MFPVLERVRRPAYTGDRRCWACTGLNVALLALATGLTALVSLPLALVLAFVGGGMIWLRGYLVPYTPYVAPRLLDRLPRGWIASSDENPPHAANSLDDSTGDDRPDRGEPVTTALIEAGVLETGNDGSRLFLAASFADRWREEQRAVRSFAADELEAAVATAVGDAVDVEVLDAAEGVEPWIGVTSTGGESWVPYAIAIAEVAAVRAIASFAPAIPPEDRVAAAGPLRAFLETCPVCEGPLVETEPTACCGAYRDRRSLPESILACADCESRVYAFDAP